METKVENKQILVNDIIKVAEYINEFYERWNKTLKEEEAKNKGKLFSEKNAKYDMGHCNIEFEIGYWGNGSAGRTITENNIEWFKENITDNRIIKSVGIRALISFRTKSSPSSDYNDESNSIRIDVSFIQSCDDTYRTGKNYSSRVSVEVDTKNQQSEGDNVYYTILNMLESREDRYNKTIKNRTFRIQSFCMSLGFVLSYIAYIVLRMNMNSFPEIVQNALINKYVIIVGQWFVAFLLGNVFGFWYMHSIYKPLLPTEKYAGYNSSSRKFNYTDNVEEYTERCEVNIGGHWDAKNRRNKIEKIFKITKIIILVQLLISVLLYFILK